MKRLLATTALLIALTTGAQAQPENFSLWGHKAVPHSDMAQFKNWSLVNKREKAMPDSGELKEWHQFLTGIAGQPLSEQMDALEERFSEKNFPYVLDTTNYWPDVQEFFNGKNDCKGFTMVKYFSLLELGVKPSDMIVVVLWDAQHNELHAVVGVFSGSDIMILDNQASKVLKAEQIKVYVPIYAIAQNKYWTFGGGIE